VFLSVILVISYWIIFLTQYTSQAQATRALGLGRCLIGPPVANPSQSPGNLEDVPTTVTGPPLDQVWGPTRNPLICFQGLSSPLLRSTLPRVDLLVCTALGVAKGSSVGKHRVDLQAGGLQAGMQCTRGPPIVLFLCSLAVSVAVMLLG
jgi:hypothetical protein